VACARRQGAARALCSSAVTAWHCVAQYSIHSHYPYWLTWILGGMWLVEKKVRMAVVLIMLKNSIRSTNLISGHASSHA
jgi:hypothetical protein